MSGGEWLDKPDGDGFYEWHAADPREVIDYARTSPDVVRVVADKVYGTKDRDPIWLPDMCRGKFKRLELSAPPPPPLPRSRMVEMTARVLVNKATSIAYLRVHFSDTEMYNDHAGLPEGRHRMIERCRILFGIEPEVSE